MNFTLRQLEYAVAVARHLNFGDGAKACSVSQPALSAQIAQLEAALGQKLFERGARGVALTPFGAEFIPQARDVIARAGHLEDCARARREPLGGEIRVGVIPTVAPFVLPRVMPILRERHPRARVFLVEGRTDTLVERLKDGQLDVLLLALEADLGDCETAAVFRDAFLLALPESHPLAARTAGVALDDVPQDQLLLLEEGHCLSRQVIDACRAATRAEAGDFRASSLVTLVQMVAAGMGITLLPEIARASDLGRTPGLALRELAGEAYRTIGLAWRRGCPRRPEFELFGRIVEEAAPT